MEKQTVITYAGVWCYSRLCAELVKVYLVMSPESCWRAVKIQREDTQLIQSEKVELTDSMEDI